MTPPSPSDPRRRDVSRRDVSRDVSRRDVSRSVCAVLTASVFVAGLLAAGVFSSAGRAAPQECLPVVGCVTTTTPSLPTVTMTVPTLPIGTTLPTLPTTTTAGGGTGSATTPTGTAESPGLQQSNPEAALSARASVRVRGHGAHRTIEISLDLSKPARVSARLVRRSRTLAGRQFEAAAGSSLLRLRVSRPTAPGAAKLKLSYRTASGETAHATYRLRLPR